MEAEEKVRELERKATAERQMLRKVANEAEQRALADHRAVELAQAEVAEASNLARLRLALQIASATRCGDGLPVLRCLAMCCGRISDESRMANPGGGRAM